MNTGGGGTQLSLGLELASSVLEDPASGIFSLGDTSVILPSNGDDSGSDLFSTEGISNLPLDDMFRSSNEGLQISDLDTSFDGLLTSSSGASCLSDADGGQFISRIKRRDVGKSCINSNMLNKGPATDSDVLPPNPGNIFPPPGSNPERIDGRENDPKPRPVWIYPIVNTDLDFKYCPSGINGYRAYAVCDSGFEHDRVRTGTTWNLSHVTRRKSWVFKEAFLASFCSNAKSTYQNAFLGGGTVNDMFFECYDPHLRWCCGNYDDDTWGPDNGYATLCKEMLINGILSDL